MKNFETTAAKILLNQIALLENDIITKVTFGMDHPRESSRLAGMYLIAAKLFNIESGIELLGTREYPTDYYTIQKELEIIANN